jgi:HSP20 family protein
MNSLIKKRHIALAEDKPWRSFFDLPDFVTRSSFASLDIEKDDDEVKVTVDLPGVKEENVDLSYENDTLLIRASREEEETSHNGYFHSERVLGKSERSLYLPEVDPDAISASLFDGVLLVKMKTVEDKGRKIKIESR